jgi:hypothetical protein
MIDGQATKRLGQHPCWACRCTSACLCHSRHRCSRNTVRSTDDKKVGPRSVLGLCHGLDCLTLPLAWVPSSSLIENDNDKDNSTPCSQFRFGSGLAPSFCNRRLFHAGCGACSERRNLSAKKSLWHSLVEGNGQTHDGSRRAAGLREPLLHVASRTGTGAVDHFQTMLLCWRPRVSFIGGAIVS